MSKRLISGAAIVITSLAARSALANVYITEFCSDTGNGEHFEFVEFTNVGYTPVNMTGWSEDDSNATPNQPNHSLSGFGTLSPGQSAIFTEATPANFEAFWGSALPANLPIVGPYTNDNLSTTADSICLFNASGTLVDRLDYSLTNGGTADMVTRNCPLSALGQNDNQAWQNSFVGDKFGSFQAAEKPSIVGNPGYYSVPEPASAGLLGLIGAVGILRRRRV